MNFSDTFKKGRRVGNIDRRPRPSSVDAIRGRVLQHDGRRSEHAGGRSVELPEKTQRGGNVAAAAGSGGL